MPFKPAYKEAFSKQLDKEYRTMKDDILALCARICENPEALHSKRLRYEYTGCRSADIPKTGGGGRGKDRLIFRMKDDLNPDIPDDTIIFIAVVDLHRH